MNVILITIDALRADHLGCYGYKRNTSPNFDRISRRGILFTKAIANAPYTTASITSLFSSTLPLIPDDNYVYVSKRGPLSKILNKQGISTFGVHSNPWFSIYDYSTGFSKFIDPFEERKIRQTGSQKIKTKIFSNDLIKDSHFYSLIENIYSKIQRKKIVSPYANADIINNTVLSLLNIPLEKFFLWIHYMDTHEPYIPNEFVFGSEISNEEITKLMDKFRGNTKDITAEEQKTIVDLYDNQIRYVDQKVGELLKTLSEVFNHSETLVIITADHGQMLGERGLFGHAGGNIPLCFFDELIHVPLFFWCENKNFIEKISKNGKFEKQIGLIDIAPTILDIFGVVAQKKSIGQSLLTNFIEKPIISQGIECKYPNQIKYFSSGIKKHCLRTIDYKLIFSESGAVELYDLNNDPKECTNISFKEHKIIMKLMNLLQNNLSSYKTMYDNSEQLKIKQVIKKLISNKKL